MKLSKYREVYYEFSQKASDVARQLAFAGIAFVWIFKYQDGDAYRIPDQLLLPAIFFAMTLALDLLQYIFATAIWGIFQWHKERQMGGLGIDPDLDSSVWLKRPQFLCFVFKLVAIIIAYLTLVLYIIDIWLKI